MYGVAGRLGEERRERNKSRNGRDGKGKRIRTMQIHMYQISTLKGGRYSSSTRTSVHVHCIYHKLHILLPF